MIKNLLSRPASVDDSKLRDILKQYDPVAPLTGLSLAALERDIFEKIDELKKNKPATMSDWVLAGIFQQGWRTQATAFASALVLAAGFLVGQTFYHAESLTSVTADLSLVAFADETSGPYLPVTETSYGENDDNNE